MGTYLTVENLIITAVVIVMLLCLKKIFRGDIGDSKVGPMLLVVVLGAALYLWQSGTAMEIFESTFGAR